MKTLQRTEYDRRVGVCYKGVFQNELVRHQHDIAMRQVPGKETRDFMMASDASAVANVVEAVVHTCRGELALNKTSGIPYFENAFGNNGDISEWTAWTTKAISETNGVKGISNFNASVEKVDGRMTLDYTVDISTDWGSVSSQVGLLTLVYPDSFSMPKDESLTKFVVNVEKPSLLYIRVQMVSDTTIDTAYVYCSDGERIAVDRDTYDKNLYNGYAMVLKRFSTAGHYIIGLDGGFQALRIGKNDDDSGSKLLPLKVISWGDSITSADYAFTGCFTGDKELPYALPPWGDNIISAQGTFMGCKAIASSQVPEWNDSMTNISKCYQGCSALGNGFEIGIEYTLRSFIVATNAAIDYYDLNKQYVKLDTETGTMRKVIETCNMIRKSLISRDPTVGQVTSAMEFSDTTAELRIKFNNLIESY